MPRGFDPGTALRRLAQLGAPPETRGARGRGCRHVLCGVCRGGVTRGMTDGQGGAPEAQLDVPGLNADSLRVIKNSLS